MKNSCFMLNIFAQPHFENYRPHSIAWGIFGCELAELSHGIASIFHPLTNTSTELRRVLIHHADCVPGSTEGIIFGLSAKYFELPFFGNYRVRRVHSFRLFCTV